MNKHESIRRFITSQHKYFYWFQVSTNCSESDSRTPGHHPLQRHREHEIETRSHMRYYHPDSRMRSSPNRFCAMCSNSDERTGS